MLDFPTWKRTLILVICALGILYAGPNFLPDRTFEGLPEWMPGKTINLGLDLQGGSHLLLEVDTDAVVKERLENLVESVRVTLRRARVRYSGLGIDGQNVVFRLREPEKIEAIRRQIRNIDPDVQITVDDSAGFNLAVREQALEDRRVNAVEQSIEIVRRRIDETGTREPTIQRQGDERIIIQLPGVKDPERIKQLLGKTAKLTFHMVNMGPMPASGRAPPGTRILPSDDIGSDGKPRTYVVRKRVRVSGDTLVDAQATFDQNNQPVVSFRFDSVGGRKFCKVSKDNVGKLFAIVLDGKVISAPVIREPICGGSGQISGSFTVAQVQDLALLLRAGALPAPLKILEERTVGPGLGRDSIEAGKIASIIGVVLVVVFMVVVYGLFGLIADAALLFNIALIVALLSGLQATLTLPGIAGIVLTMGMAVDANVLIFERIREEIRSGQTLISAIDAGYRRALTTIIDSNLTTLIAAVLLFVFGSGPIKGFAVTLSLGIMTSMFTAIMLTRMLIVIWLRRTRPQALPI
ncbi:MAG: protein translocase subunit SecD [Alphaproteobacteria bacterium]|nr:protein translocase subunit SecD [Alphaproteobacteria bacterium]